MWPAVTRGPFSQQLIKDALFRARGDMVAGEIKAVKEVDSVKGELPLLVSQEEAPDVYKLAEDDAIEIGPFLVSLSKHPLPAILLGTKSKRRYGDYFNSIQQSKKLSIFNEQCMP